MRRLKRWSCCDGEAALVQVGKRGDTVLVDAADIDVAMSSSWHIAKGGYAAATRDKENVYLHHLIVGKPVKPLEVDHINGDRLDNRRANLRVVTRSVNQRNRHKTSAVSGLLGAHWFAQTGKWVAKICDGETGPDGRAKSRHLGIFSTKEEAAAAYQRAKEARDG